MAQIDPVLTHAVAQSLPEFVKLLFAAVGGGLLGAYANNKYTTLRERKSGRENRKKGFLSFMRGWRHEVDFLHNRNCGFSRNTNVFYDGVPVFLGETELIRKDFCKEKMQSFLALVSAISTKVSGHYSYNHDELIKTMDELIALVDEN